MIRLEGVTKSYNKKNVLINANLHAKEGEITLLTGKSGSGKSTLLNIISGIQVYDSGNYFVNKVKLDVYDDQYMSQFRNAKIGYIVQDYALIEEYSVLENILLPSMYNKKFEKKDIQDKAILLAKDFGLFDIIYKKVKHISGGQKQRTAIARSLILDPAIILADEPTTNLDEENFLLIIDLFESLKKAKKLIIIATHDDRIKSIANKIYRIDDTILEQES
ncbi:ABC transporter ATP-binding protein [Enterococcus sp.]|uniref:ABC transporter ATP-binding protein n=1 Tax=Enterococcus sp. TaxID=35783 RepID=UPI0028AE0C63|nr:ABC transporter ATP-binding protein [Enterococcus sp.]